MNHDAALEVLIKPTVAKRYGLIAAAVLPPTRFPRRPRLGNEDE
jgi:hypothetical protein